MNNSGSFTKAESMVGRGGWMGVEYGRVHRVEV